MRKGERDPSLPLRTDSPNKKAIYSWDNLSEKRMMEYGVDFRPPSVDKSWFWVMDNSQFGSEGQWLPSGEGLSYQRHALLLEYLPRARRMDSHVTTKKLALQALAGAQSIQKALVVHGDQSRHNLLVTKDDRVVWVDFDRAIVLDKVNANVLVGFKRDLINVHDMLFSSFYKVGPESTKLLRAVLINA